MIKSSEDLPFTISVSGIELTVKEMPIKEKAVKEIGMSHYSSQSIYIRTKGIGIDLVNQALFHELLHWIFFLMNENEITANEKMIDHAALLLHDAMKSM